MKGEGKTRMKIRRQSSDPTLGISLSYPAALPSKFLRRTCASHISPGMKKEDCSYL